MQVAFLGSIPRDGRRRAPSVLWVLTRRSSHAGSGRRPGLPPRGGCCDVRSVSEGSPRSGHAHARHCPPCSVRCVCPPPAAPGPGRTRRRRAGILRLRAHPGRGRPAPEASGGPRRGPRGRVHVPLKDLGRAPETVAAGVLTAGTPPGPERGVGGRTGLSPRRRSCSRVHLRGPATRGAGDGGGTRRPPSAPYPGGDAPRAWLAPGVSAASCPLPRDAAVSGRPERVRGARSPSRCRHARVVRPAPRPSRGEGMDARRLTPQWLPTHAPTSGGLTSAAAGYVERGGRPPRRRTSRAYRTGKRRRPDPRGDPACGVRRRSGQWANLPRENS